MPIVHIFASHNRFSSREALEEFVDPTYSGDGDRIDSPFMLEIGFEKYEPMCIEVMHSDVTERLEELLRGASYWQQWLPSMSNLPEANCAVCVFPPNELAHPENSSLKYCGAARYCS